MTNHWILSPYDSSFKKIFNRAWKFDLENNTMAVGWARVGQKISEIASRDHVALREEISAVYPEKTISVCGRDANEIKMWFQEISEGDYVIARRGRNKIVGWGRVFVPEGSSDFRYFSEDDGLKRVGDAPEVYPNFLKVKWTSTMIHLKNSLEMDVKTVDKIDKKRFEELIYLKGIELVVDGEDREPKFHSSYFLKESIQKRFEKKISRAISCSKDGRTILINAIGFEKEADGNIFDNGDGTFFYFLLGSEQENSEVALTLN